MKSRFSCFGNFILLCIALVFIRYAAPGFWRILIGIFAGTVYFSLFIFLVALAVLAYFIYKNLRGNQQQEEEKKYSRVSQTEAVYQSIVKRLQEDLTLNQVTAEEFLQSEILVGEKLKSLKMDLIRLKDFTSPKNERLLNQQIRDYRQQLQQSTDPSAKEVIQENLNMLQEKKQRMASALEEIRQKEASVDLVYNSLINVEEDLKFGRPVQRLLPPDVYQRFELSPPAEQPPLPPLMEKSSTEE